MNAGDRTFKGVLGWDSVMHRDMHVPSSVKRISFLLTHLIARQQPIVERIHAW